MNSKLIFSVFSLFFFLASCSNNSVSPNKATVTIGFNHINNVEPLELDIIKYTNAVGQNYSIKTVKYFVSRITFHSSNGADYTSSVVHYIDIRTPKTLELTIDKVIPYGTYSGVSFVYGLVPDENQTGNLGIELDRLMEWPPNMGGGYHYMKLEGEYIHNGETNFFNFHAGGLDGEAYEIHVDLPDSGFEINSDRLEIGINMEISNWFQNPIAWDFAYWGAGIMGNADAQATVQKNGEDVFTITLPTPNN
jgi:methanobactin biosynthesis MbnP-like protein